MYDDINQPVMVDGHPVSFWHAVTGGEPTPAHIDLAHLLAAYHAATGCPCDLATFEPLRISESRLAKAKGVDAKDLDFLHHRITDLTKQFARLGFALPERRRVSTRLKSPSGGRAVTAVFSGKIWHYREDGQEQGQ